MWPIEDIVKTIKMKQILGEMRDSERVGGHDFPLRVCDTLYGSLVSSPTPISSEQDNSLRTPDYTEIEDPVTGSYLPRPVEE